MTDQYIDNDELISIADTFNEVISSSDKKRLDFSKTLLAIYTPVTSGLLFLSTSIQLGNIAQKVVFLMAVTTSSSIVLSALIERLAYFLSSKTIAEKFTKHVRGTGKHTNGPLKGEKWQNKLISSQVYIMSFLVLVNIVSVVIFVYLKVL